MRRLSWRLTVDRTFLQFRRKSSPRRLVASPSFCHFPFGSLDILLPGVRRGGSWPPWTRSWKQTSRASRDFSTVHIDIIRLKAYRCMVTQAYVFGHLLHLPEGLSDETAYTFASSTDIIVGTIEEAKRGSTYLDHVATMRSRLQVLSGPSFRLVDDFESTKGEIRAITLSYEVETNTGLERIRHVFLSRQQSPSSWVQLNYKTQGIEWRDIATRCSFERLNPILAPVLVEGVQKSRRACIGEICFSLPEEMQNKSRYELVSGSKEFSIAIERDVTPHPKRRLDPESLGIESVGGKYTRFAPPLIKPGFPSSAGVWWHSSFPGVPPRDYYHYGERLRVGGSPTSPLALVISATAYAETSVEPMSMAVARITELLNHV